MSNPKEKAKELVEKYYELFSFELENTICIYEAKHCALIAVDEIEKAIDFDWIEIQNLESEHRYWEQVKEELKKL
jgi:hypothetical protein